MCKSWFLNPVWIALKPVTGHNNNVSPTIWRKIQTAQSSQSNPFLAPQLRRTTDSACWWLQPKLWIMSGLREVCGLIINILAQVSLCILVFCSWQHYRCQSDNLSSVITHLIITRNRHHSYNYEDIHWQWTMHVCEWQWGCLSRKLIVTSCVKSVELVSGWQHGSKAPAYVLNGHNKQLAQEPYSGHKPGRKPGQYSWAPGQLECVKYWELKWSTHCVIISPWSVTQYYNGCGYNCASYGWISSLSTTMFRFNWNTPFKTGCYYPRQLTFSWPVYK